MANKTPGRSKKTPNKPLKQPIPINSGIDPLAKDLENARVAEHPGMEEEIRRRAYELYEERGRQEGFHEEDWVRAETEILSRHKREKSA